MLTPQEHQALSQAVTPQIIGLLTKALGAPVVQKIKAAIASTVQAQPVAQGPVAAQPTKAQGPAGFAMPPHVGQAVANGPVGGKGMAQGGFAGDFASSNPATAQIPGDAAGGVVAPAAPSEDDKLANQQAAEKSLPNGFNPTSNYTQPVDSFAQDLQPTGAGFASGGLAYNDGGPVIDPNAKPSGPGLPPGDPTSPDNSKVSAETQPAGATADDQTAKLSKGEFVLDAATVAFFGVGKLKQMQLQAHKALSEEASQVQGAQPGGQGLGSPPPGPAAPPQGAPPPAQGAPQQAAPMPTSPPPSTMPNPTEQRIAATDNPKGPPNRSPLGI